MAAITTEHFTLQGARSSTTSEATGRATMFLGSISGGLIALGLIGTATHVGAAFYAVGLILVPTLVFVGLVTFERTIQSGVEDFGYARRIAQLRGFYFDVAPQLEPYLLSIPQPQSMRVQGLHKGMWQGFLAVSGMVAVVTAVLFGSTVGLSVAVASGHSLAAALIAGVPSGVAALVVLIWYQCHTWNKAIANEFMPESIRARAAIWGPSDLRSWPN